MSLKTSHYTGLPARACQDCQGECFKLPAESPSFKGGRAAIFAANSILEMDSEVGATAMFLIFYNSPISLISLESTAQFFFLIHFFFLFCFPVILKMELLILARPK